MEIKKLLSFTLFMIFLISFSIARFIPSFSIYAVGISIGALLAYVFVIRGVQTTRQIKSIVFYILGSLTVSMILMYIIHGPETMDSKVKASWDNVSNAVHHLQEKLKGDGNNVHE